jgi:hypothetical protein
LPGPADLDVDERELLADGTSIPVVAQPRDVAVSQYIRNRGGYDNLKRIQAVEMLGRLEVDGHSYPLNIRTARPEQMRRVLTVGDQVSVAEIATDDQVRLDPSVDRGLPAALESRLLESFEFDGRLVEWPDKGHQVSMQGMQKIGDVLAWKLELVQGSGQRWELFINSHGGDLVMANMLDENDQLEYSIVQSDFRETSGFKYPHRIEYIDRDGQSLGVEVLEAVLVDQQVFDLAGETIVH